MSDQGAGEELSLLGDPKVVKTPYPRRVSDLLRLPAGPVDLGKMAPQAEQWRKDLLGRANPDGSFG